MAKWVTDEPQTGQIGGTSYHAPREYVFATLRVAFGDLQRCLIVIGNLLNTDG